MAIDEGLRSRLEALNRGPVPEPPCTVPQAVSAAVRATASAGPPRKQAPHPAPSAQPAPAWRSGLVRPIAGLLRRGDSEATDAGEHWRVQLPLDAIWPGGEELVARRRELLASRPPAPPADGEPTEWPAAFPRGVLFLDLETCGFSGSALFLAGLLRETEGRLAVELLLARDYSEEAAVLASLWRRLGECTSIVTFNGKSFDWPMVVDRTRRHRLPMGGRPGSQAECGDGPLRSASPPDAAQHGQAPPSHAPRAMPPHIDLLHLARRRWRREVPNCKLQTLERHICGRIRSEDLPSSQIPAAYQQYVRTGFEREMDAILLHNAIDLVTMLDLAMRLQGAA